MLQQNESSLWSRTIAVLRQGRGAPGYRWRASRAFNITMISFAMFSDTFIFSFIVPILSDMLEHRIHLPESQTQYMTSLVLSMNAFVSILIAPLVGHLADKTSWRNGLMILSWMFNLVGTAITAWSTTLIGLFMGRLLQTFAGSIIFLVGMPIIGEAAGSKNLAKALAYSMLWVSAGLLSGPAVAGALYDLAGYTATWLTAMGILVVGTIMQCLMIERGDADQKPDAQWDHSDSATDHDEESHSYPPTPPDTTDLNSTTETEASALLPPPSASAPPVDYQTITEEDDSCKSKQANTNSQPPSQNLYWTMLRRAPVSTSLVADIVFAIVLSSFEATLPIHVKELFGWKSLQAGLMFLVIQIPPLVLLTPAGWLKDKIGMRIPVTIGFLLFAPSLWLLGVPGKDSFPWANHGDAGQKIFIAALIAIGGWRTLLLGFGSIEVMNGAKQLETEQPGIFGPNGGLSRCFAMSNISWKLGMLLGPLISGGLVETVGYYYMNLVLAILCAVMGIATFVVLRKR